MNTNDVLYIVVPCYNEEEVLPKTATCLEEKLAALISAEKVSDRSRVLFVDDGSSDSTWNIIQALHKSNNIFSGLKLSRNRGHQNALLAGLMAAKDRCHVCISMDADLQDDVNAVDQMIEKYREGCDIVYGVRSSRKKDNVFKRMTARGFYGIMKLMGAQTVYDHADYRLMSRRALEALSEFKEKNLFLRGMVPLIGFRSDTVPYERGERVAGKSKYPLRKMLAFAVDGITSFSSRPLRYITVAGFLIFLVSIVMIVSFIVQWALGGTVSGWASIVCSIWGMGGLIVLSLGIIGEYIGKIFVEIKQRPSFIVDELVDGNDGTGAEDGESTE